MIRNSTFSRVRVESRLTKISSIASIFIFSVALQAHAQTEPFASSRGGQVHATSTPGSQKVVKITGVRFSYPLIQKWIDEFEVVHPEIQVIIESRGTSDPTQYDILVEGYEHPESTRLDREYVYVAQYAVLPVASAKSLFARTYATAGLGREEIIQLFFHDPYADREKSKTITTPFTVYTRLQKAASPIVFSNYFGYDQKDIKGKTIAGSDEHLIKALLRDSTGISYAPVPVIYDPITKVPHSGISVIPVDLNANGRLGEDEKFYSTLNSVVDRFDASVEKDLKNVPVSQLHLSVGKKTASPDALTFLRWVIANGGKDLKAFGYLRPANGNPNKEQFEQFAAKFIRP